MKVFCKCCDAYIDIEKEMFCPNCGADLSESRRTAQRIQQKNQAKEIERAFSQLKLNYDQYENYYQEAVTAMRTYHQCNENLLQNSRRAMTIIYSVLALISCAFLAVFIL